MAGSMQVLLYLPDDDLIAWLRRCKEALRPAGVMCVKENVVIQGVWHVDREDNSIMRTDEQYKAVFSSAGLEVIAEAIQENWPKTLFPVKMYALR
mmetsp:Transcript_71731/g.134153  ORF Transcript_71731/g.134153 Transcript_71731/m.134153 type:complete len:95 (+) Transcript_71731:41-325(+)